MFGNTGKTFKSSPYYRFAFANEQEAKISRKSGDLLREGSFIIRRGGGVKILNSN